jgi:hypothetical protein
MAKVKKAGKENVLAHVMSVVALGPCSIDYNAIA